MCCSGLYFHLLALCVFVHIPPQPHGPLPRLSSSLFFPPSSESSSNSSFPSITFLYRSASVVSPSLSLSSILPFVLFPSTPFSLSVFVSSLLPSLTVSPQPPRILLPHPTTRLIPSSPLIRSLCFSPTCVSRLFPLGSRPTLAMGPIQFPSCNFQSIHKRLSSSKAIDGH